MELVIAEILLIIWGICTLGLLVALIRDGLEILVYSNNTALNGRITRLYHAGMYESGDVLKPQFIKSWQDLYKRYL